jgi:hypothetical protein
MKLSLSKKSHPNLELNRARKGTSECEAVRCKGKATITIAVPVGDKGLIFVSVCKNCAGKFGPECGKKRRAAFVEKRA